jgi:Tol biopolymer transport system component
MQLVALTTLTGAERGATFSPDGRQVAFTWSGEAQDNWDIHVKLVGSPDVRRLTTHPARDIAPRWSFDGRQIAYLRAEPSGNIEFLRVMSALGGGDRQVSELAVLPQPAWSPDDQWIAAGLAPAQTGKPGGIHLVPLTGREPRQLTRSPVGGVDWMPAFSPDGRRLAYSTCRDFTTNCHIYVLTLDAGFGAVGSARRLTVEPLSSIRGVAWSRDGSSVIYGAIHGASNDVWRVRADGNAPPQRIEIAGLNASYPATTLSTDRLAFTRGVVDQDVYAFDVDRGARPIARSSVFDGNAQFSPDQQKVAFCSDRTADATEVWIADADGSHPEQLTHGPGRWQCSPAWSPDGRSIAFESRGASGESQIYSIDVNVRQLRQLTTGGGDRKLPSWSRTGEWVYFSWDRGTGRDIWRVQRTGGSPAPVTNGGSGLAAVEGADGVTLFYLGHRTARIHEPTDAPLLARPPGGGPPREVVACVRGTAFSVGANGIYYLPCRSASGGAGDPSVFFLDLATGTERSLGTLERYENNILSGFSASYDGRTFLYSRLISRGEDLMLVENFR